MAVERRRACGYRKIHGLYLCSDGSGGPCCKLPILLEVCPTCNGGIKQTRSWQWIDPRPWLPGGCTSIGVFCPVAEKQLGERVGLLWIGEQFYRTPGAFQQEAAEMGISRRIKAIPHGFKLGETWVFFAHPKVKQRVDQATGEVVWVGGVFRIFKPERVEKIVTQSEFADEAEMARLREAGIVPVPVPDDDKDHQGSVYDKEEEEPLLV
jgi:hypothetical protein